MHLDSVQEFSNLKLIISIASNLCHPSDALCVALPQ